MKAGMGPRRRTWTTTTSSWAPLASSKIAFGASAARDRPVERHQQSSQCGLGRSVEGDDHDGLRQPRHELQGGRADGPRRPRHAAGADHHRCDVLLRSGRNEGLESRTGIDPEPEAAALAALCATPERPVPTCGDELRAEQVRQPVAVARTGRTARLLSRAAITVVIWEPPPGTRPTRGPCARRFVSARWRSADPRRRSPVPARCGR